MVSEIDRITRLLEKTFDKQPWYGNSIMATLKGLTPTQASQKIGPGHSIIELVLHMTSWRAFATHRLLGDNTFEVSEDLNFPKPGTWEEALIKLQQSQKELIDAAKNFPEERLSELVPSNTQRYTYYTLLHGIAQHDIYHLGQMAYIKRAVS